MKEYELSNKLKELKSLREKYRYFQVGIDIIKNEIWDPYDYPNVDKDIWEKQTIEEIKSRGQILKHLEERIRELKKHIKKLNKEQNERNNAKQYRKINEYKTVKKLYKTL